MKHSLQLFILLSLFLIFSSILGSMSKFFGRDISLPGLTVIEIMSASDGRSNLQADPTETISINLPIIEQNEQNPTPEPIDAESGTVIEPETPTPTPIPVQTGTTNLPIVIGALAIILVVFLAWFFLGYLPSRRST